MAKKRNTRPALRAGVSGGDGTALSCYTFEPSVLPLPWAFCRSPARQNRALPGAKSVTGRQVDFPASRHLLLCCPPKFEGENRSLRRRSTRLRHCVSSLWRCTGATQSAGAPQTASQCETGGFADLGCDSNRIQQLLADTILPNKSAAIPAIFKTFWGCCPIDKESLFDYSVVEFSMLSFS